jgi:hypothetical protein
MLLYNYIEREDTMPRRKMQAGAGVGSTARSAARAVGSAAYRGANWVYNNPQTIRRYGDNLRNGLKNVRLGANAVMNHPTTRMMAGLSGVGDVENYLVLKKYLDNYNAVAEPLGLGRKRRARRKAKK